MTLSIFLEKYFIVRIFLYLNPKLINVYIHPDGRDSSSSI